MAVMLIRVIFTILLYKFALKGNIISVYKGTMDRIFSSHLPAEISVRMKYQLHSYTQWLCACMRPDTFTNTSKIKFNIDSFIQVIFILN